LSPSGQKKEEDGVGNLMSFTFFTKYDSGDQIMTNEMSRTCDACGEEEKWPHGFDGKIWRKESLGICRRA
jgi:hypothetical protein